MRNLHLQTFSWHFQVFVNWQHSPVCFLPPPCSSDVDSDRETRRRKKKKRKHRDSSSEQRSPGAARISEERESRKRHHADAKDSKHDNDMSPEKRLHTDGSRDHLLPSHHNPASNDLTHAHLNGYTGSESFNNRLLKWKLCRNWRCVDSVL